MVSVVTKGRIYEYPGKVKELLLINTELRNDFNKIAKELNISKSKLVQEIYKRIIIDYRTGILKKPDRNITVAIKRRLVSKCK